MLRPWSALLMLFLLFISGCAVGQNNQPAVLGQQIVASDYAAAGNWLALPQSLEHQADVIYFYPTLYTRSGPNAPLVGPIDDPGMRAEAPDLLFRQAMAFADCADIYAPFYRQVDVLGLTGLSQPEWMALEIGAPKVDAFAALDYYFQHYNQGRPYFLVGHSQGGMMVYLILDEYMEQHPDYYERMVAAYMLGNAPTRDWLAANPHVLMAEGPDDLGVLISWNVEAPGNIGQYNLTVPEGAVCINPLNWRRDETPALAEENLGSLLLGPDGAYRLVPGLVDAVIDLERGSVICTSLNPARFRGPERMWPLLGTDNYHGGDFTFYYANIGQNAQNRLQRFLARQ